MDAQLPGKQEVAPYPNLAATKEKRTVLAVPVEVHMTQGFTLSGLSLSKLDGVVARAVTFPLERKMGHEGLP